VALRPNCSASLCGSGPRCRARSLARPPVAAASHRVFLVYFLYLVSFEFDPAKSAANLEKHGIDFGTAQALWNDRDRIEIPARSFDEPRTQVVGRIGEQVWSGSSHHGPTASGSFPSDEHAMKKKQRTSRSNALSAAKLDAMHDAGVDLSAHVELARAARPGRAVQRVNVDFPVDLLREIDHEARRLGVTRQAFIKVRLADALGAPSGNHSRENRDRR
jgi:hypothetical protein